MALTIAIDGPVGAGKSRIAARLAQALDILHLDTGAMYRALALKALREGIDPHDERAVDALCGRTDIGVALHDGGQRTILDGEDVTSQIRTPEVGAAASAVSQWGGVRRHMVALQQAYAAGADMILDGRDIGTRVLPDATFKFYLTGAPQVRARRRYDEHIGRGEDADYDDVLRELMERDDQDMNRAEDPLRQAKGAVLIDTTEMTEDAVLARLLAIIREEGA